MNQYGYTQYQVGALAGMDSFAKIHETERFTAFFRLIGDSAVAPLVLLVTAPCDGLKRSILSFSD